MSRNGQRPPKKPKCRCCGRSVKRNEEGDLLHEASGRFACYPEAAPGTPQWNLTATET